MGRLELHEHCYITGPKAGRSSIPGGTLVHSHEGGDRPHEHDDGTNRTGPGSYTIDKDEWRARTGLIGGGRKRFTRKPTGSQLPVVVVEPPQIKVVIVGDGGKAAARGTTGAGFGAVHRMQLAMKAEVASVTHVPGGERSTRKAAAR
jgi:hypothetical protein